MPPHRHAYRPVVMGRRGAVASAHPLASVAGIRILLEGGNAVDAAVAVGSTLNVVEPFMSSAGGIGLMFVSRRGGAERHVLDFIGRAPAAANAARATEDELAGGPKACATPGNLGGWMAALERFGSMPRGRVLAPAIDWAEQGVPLTFMNTNFIEQARPQLGRSVEAQRLYLSNGGPRPGKIATYKELASTFRQVAEGGSEVFYRGPIAKAIARAVQEAGGWLSESDLAEFKPEWREPIRIGYRGFEICSVPPPFSAFQMLETLNILEGFDVAGWGHNSVEYLHHLIEAVVFKAVFDVGGHHVPYARLSVPTARDRPRNDVPIGDRSNQTVIRADGKKAQILFCHVPGGLLERVIWTNQAHVAAHDIGNLD